MTYSYNERYSNEKVFDLVNHGFSTDLEYQYFRLLILFAAYKIESGEVVSTAIPNSKILAAAETVAFDDVFSPGLDPASVKRCRAYRLDATSHQFNAGMNVSIGKSTEIELATKYHYTDAEGGNRYQGLIYYANFWYTF